MAEQNENERKCHVAVYLKVYICTNNWLIQGKKYQLNLIAQG